MKILLIGVLSEEKNRIKSVLKDSSMIELAGPFNKKLVDKILQTYKAEKVDFIFADDHLISGKAAAVANWVDDLKNQLSASFIWLIEQEPKASVKKVIQTCDAEVVCKPIVKPDLEARVRTSAQLRQERMNREEAEQWFVQVTEHMPVIFANYEDGFKVNYGNTLGTEIWGVPPEDIIGSSDGWIKYVHQEDQGRVVESIKNLGKEPLFIQYRIIRPDGQMRWIDDSFIPVFDEDGHRTKVFGFGQDITKRKLAEHSLQKTEEHLQSLMETATNFAVYRLSIRDNDPLCTDVVFASPSIMDLLGVTEPGFAAWLDLMHPDDSRRIKENLAKQPLTPKFEDTIRIFHPVLQEWRWIRFIANHLFDEKSQLIYSNGIIFDVTTHVKTTNNLKEKEEELTVQAEKLQKVNNALSVLLEHQEQKSEEIRSNILETLDKFVLPYIHDLTLTTLTTDQTTFINMIKSHLVDISSSFAKSLSNWKSRLSPTEIKVADFVRSGKTSKEIAELLNVSIAAISFHRKNIRSKLEINNEKVNLVTHLQMLGQD